MRSAALVAVLALMLTFLLGFVRAGPDIDDEMQSAMALVSALGRLGDAARLPDASLIEALSSAQRDGSLRHLTITLTDAQGRTLVAPAAPAVRHNLLESLVDLHAAWQGAAPVHGVAWPVARSDGSQWMVTFTGARDSERREAMTGLALSLGVVCVGLLATLAVMAWNVRRALRPLRDLLGAIGRLQRGEPGAMAALPAMPIRELQSIASALRRLDDALQAAEAQRRVLGQKVLTLQEDERQRLAQELHDEFGQRLTALRADAAWLQRQFGANAALSTVAEGMAANCEHIQHDIRSLLYRLRPLGPESGRLREPVARLPPLLRPLIEAWSRGTDSPAVEATFQCVDEGGRPVPWPAPDDGPAMPHDLQLALYRMTQEALTNAARHARAAQVRVSLRLWPAASTAALEWMVEDDGVGLPPWEQAVRRGSGLAGMRERAWAQGADLQADPARPGEARPGLRLAARFEFDARPRTGAAEGEAA